LNLSGGSILTPRLATFNNGSLLVGSAADFPDLTNIDNSSVMVFGGSLSLPLITSYANNSSAVATLEAYGTGSDLTLPNLSALSSTAGGVTFEAAFAVRLICREFRRFRQRRGVLCQGRRKPSDSADAG